MALRTSSGDRLAPLVSMGYGFMLDDTIAAKPADNALVTTFVARMKAAKDIDQATQEELAGEAIAAVDGVAAGAKRLPDQPPHVEPVAPRVGPAPA